MIRLLAPESATEAEQEYWLGLARHTPCLGPRMQVDWLLRKQNPAMPYRFYSVDGAALLEVAGDTGLLCGAVADGNQLEAFLRFLGVRRFLSTGWTPPDWPLRQECIMELERPNTGVAEMAVIADPQPPVREMLQVIWAAGTGELPLAWDALYADLCARRNHGFAAFYGIWEQDALTSVAGAWCITEEQVYLAGVATLPRARGKGYAAGLVRLLCGKYQGRQVVLLCRPELQSFYAPIGFARRGILLEATGEDNAK